MYVIKRNGEKEPVKFDKITSRITALCEGLNPEFVDPVRCQGGKVGTGCPMGGGGGRVGAGGRLRFGANAVPGADLESWSAPAARRCSSPRRSWRACTQA